LLSQVTCVLSGHVINRKIPSRAITRPIKLKSLQDGYKLSLQKTPRGFVAVNGRIVTSPDIAASNGIVHSLSKVLLPDCATKNLVQLLSRMPGDFSTLVRLVKAAGLTTALSETTDRGYTLLAPNNAAFKNVPKYILDFLASDVDALKQVLTYHVIPRNIPSNAIASRPVRTLQGRVVNIAVNGNTIRFNDAVVVEADKLAKNGIVHEINAVLLPPNLALPSAPRAAPAEQTPVRAPASSMAGPPRNMEKSSNSGEETRSSQTSYYDVQDSGTDFRTTMFAATTVIVLLSVGLII